ncbi:hypothetical protein G6F68_019686 [Rhizopus microsporus]|nr:hypothetical protein G6F68_019686 [Rhizopus microsporus]
MPPNAEIQTDSLKSAPKHPDPRHPLYVGTWKRSIPYIHDDFARDDMDEPHLKRKHTILRQHPDVEKLYGTDIRTFYVTLAITITQLGIAYYFGQVYQPPVYIYLLTAYFVGATMTDQMA